MLVDRTPIVSSPFPEHSDMLVSPSGSDIEMHTPYLDTANFSPSFPQEETKRAEPPLHLEPAAERATSPPRISFSEMYKQVQFVTFIELFEKMCREGPDVLNLCKIPSSCLEYVTVFDLLDTPQISLKDYLDRFQKFA